MRERIQVGDLVALPLKSRSAIALGRVTGPYRFSLNASQGGMHQRSVTWLRTDVPRTEVDQDLLFSLGGTLTVFQVRRNEAESRMLAYAEGRQPQPANADLRPGSQPEAVEPQAIEIERYAQDQITSFIAQKFKGHDLTRLVAGILRAQGYQAEESPPGADGGVDILAGQGPMGFDPPRLVVQVKSSESPIDVSVLRELQGVLPSFGGDRGLIVSWGGFRTSVPREARRHFFSVRLWDADDLVRALQESYSKLAQSFQLRSRYVRFGRSLSKTMKPDPQSPPLPPAAKLPRTRADSCPSRTSDQEL